MGRHSSSDDEGDDVGLAGDESVGVLALDVTPSRGRHSADSDEDLRPSESASDEAVGRESGTRADVRLLRRDRSVRARCLAAALVPFLLYTVVMVIIGRTDVYLLWIWIPIVLAGVLVGVCLDLGHRAETNKGQGGPGPPAGGR